METDPVRADEPHPTPAPHAFRGAPEPHPSHKWMLMLNGNVLCSRCNAEGGTPRAIQPCVPYLTPHPPPFTPTAVPAETETHGTTFRDGDHVVSRSEGRVWERRLTADQAEKEGVLLIQLAHEIRRGQL